MIPDHVKIEITSADITGLIQQVSCCGATLFDFIQSDDLSVTCFVKNQDLPMVEKLANRRGDSIRIIYRSVFWQVLQSVGRRSVLLIGMAIFLALVIYLPARVLFIRVEGNQTIPAQLIIQKAEECGVRLGTSRKHVRSEQVKNSLLSHFPQLQWAGVNTNGCVAVISVEEKTPEYSMEKQSGVSSIIADYDGVITELTVRNGNPMCQVGQAVQKGQLLVSGYIDCGLKVQLAHADADITAQTIRRMDLMTPINRVQRGNKLNESRKFMLLIGKKLIKLYNGSGIYDGSCVKMYTKKYMKLPGGFQLPIALITVNCIYYSSDLLPMSQWQGKTLLLSFAKNELKNQMVAGCVLREDVVMISEAGCYRLVGEYICSEMIGKSVHEESFYIHGKDH